MAISINMQVGSMGGSSATSSPGNSNTIEGLKQKTCCAESGSEERFG